MSGGMKGALESYRYMCAKGSQHNDDLNYAPQDEGYDEAWSGKKKRGR